MAAQARWQSDKRNHDLEVRSTDPSTNALSSAPQILVSPSMTGNPEVCQYALEAFKRNTEAQDPLQAYSLRICILTRSQLIQVHVTVTVTVTV